MMNGAFSTQNPEKIAVKIQEKLVKELSLASPPDFQIDLIKEDARELGNVLTDMGKNLFGGKETLLFTIRFQLKGSLAAELLVHVNQQGVGSHLGTLAYSTSLDKPIQGEIILTVDPQKKQFSFQGTDGLVAKLNSQRDLMAKITDFAKTEAEVGGLKITAPLFVQLKPKEKQTMFFANTLTSMKMLGFSCSLGATEFLSITQLIQNL